MWILFYICEHLCLNRFFVMQADRHISHAARHFLKFAQQHVEQYLDTQWVRNELHNLDLN